MKPAIVVAGYDRPASLKRILSSISRAHYAQDDIPLIISLDHCDSDDGKACRETAEKFVWYNGSKKVRLHDERMGLKKHILSCGDLSHEYGAVIVLEDDLYVSKGFYDYACGALEFSQGRDCIAGISLYSHRFNVFAREPFEPEDDGFDNFYMQLASSWGQAWSAVQWDGFRNWLGDNQEENFEGLNIPSDVGRWGEKSWLKFAIKYLVSTEKYFLYPMKSYTTNFADTGVHAAHSVNDLQVPLASEPVRDFCFSAPEGSRSVYDAYFENMRLDEECDMYGLKERDGRMSGKKFYSGKPLPYLVKKSFGMSMRPAEMNITENIAGDDIFLYDSSVHAAPPRVSSTERVKYLYRGINKKKILGYVWNIRSI